MKERRRHRALSSATFAVLLWLLPTATRAQTVPAPSPAPAATQDADDPFAVLAAKPVKVRPQSEREVRIVRPDGTPAADAIVVLVAEPPNADTSPQRRAAALRWPGDEPRQLALLARDGERLAVGPRGEVMTPKHGRLYTFTRDGATDRRVDSILDRLHLVAPHTCTVEVVDEAGRPMAAAPIGLRTTSTGLLLGRHTTGTDGTLPLRLLLSQPHDCRIGLDLCTDAAIDAPLPPIGGRVRLTMPKTTALTATFVDDPSLRRAQACYLTSPRQKVRHYGELRGGNSVVWPHVVIGSEVTATLELGPIGSVGRARWQQVATAQVSTTVAANPPKLELGVRFERPMLVLQLFDAAGEPAARRDGTLRLAHGDEDETLPFRSDDEGFLELLVPPQFADGQPVQAALHLYGDETARRRRDYDAWVPLRYGRNVPVGCAEFELRLDGPRLLRLGPTRCQPMPVLASGQLVLADGTALAGVDLGTEPGLRFRTDANGRFELRGARPDHEASERSTEFTLDPPWCFLGNSPWLATLRHGVISQRFVVQRAIAVPLPDDLSRPDLNALEFQLEATDGAGPSVDVAIDWQERRLLLPPGAWHFVVRSDATEVARWPNLRPGASDERRLDPFDWRSFARLVEVRIVDREGAPARRCRAYLPGYGSFIVNTNVVRILTPHAGVGLEIRAGRLDGEVSLKNVAENRTVMVGPRPHLRVVLQPPPNRPPGVVLELAIGDGDGVSFDEHFTAELPLESAGPVTPTVRVRGGGPRPVTVDWPLPRVDVTRQGATLTFEVTPEHQRALEQAIERARPR
jgi:hypothetical protein